MITSISPVIPSGIQFQRLSLRAEAVISLDQQLVELIGYGSAKCRQADALRRSVEFSSMIEGDCPHSTEKAAQCRIDGLKQAYEMAADSESIMLKPFDGNSILAAHHYWLSASLVACGERDEAQNPLAGNPGEFRARMITIGQHVAPESRHVPVMISSLQDSIKWVKSPGELLVALIAHHHRFLWIHPFEDGNGRISRLMMDIGFLGLGMSGLWSLSEFLFAHKDRYYRLLHQADQPRRGDLDGRGNLSLSGLVALIDFILDCMSDAISQAARGR